MRVACNVVHLFAQNAIALQGFGAKGVHHSAIASAIEVLNSQLVGTQFVGPFVGIGAGLRHVEAQNDCATGGGVGVGGGLAAGKNGRQGKARAHGRAGFQQLAATQG